MASKTKSICLRAFRIENHDPKKSKSNLIDLLYPKLENSKIADRRVLINKDDPDKEEHLILDFDSSRKDKFLFGTMIHIASVEGMQDITDEILKKNRAALSEIENIKTDSKTICKNHFYFASDGRHMIITLPRNRTIAAFQGYINEYLKSERGEIIYEFTPLTEIPSETTANEVKSIAFSDSALVISNQETSNQPSTKKFNITKNLLVPLFKDSKELDKIIEEGFVSAELLIKFAKKKKSESFDKIMGAILKPVADTENITIIKKNGEKIKGSRFEKVNNVSIEITKSNMISEVLLSQAMELFLKELK